MQKVYAASKDCPFLIHALQPPHASQNGKQYIVDLEPVGQPAVSKHSDQRPRCSDELKNSIRCILHALKWMLIDLEFACVSNGIPFTQEGIYWRKSVISRISQQIT
ncbi:hypothetical protein WJX79_009964 [Trebouxia sp. C0005]